jgi:hypothetical protein
MYTMSKSTITTIVAVLALLVAGVALLQANAAPPPQVFENQGVSNFDSIHLSDLPEGTATPVFIVNEESGGSANIMEVRAASTPVWSVSSAGAIAQTGGLDLNGADLTIDADADTILGQTGSTDDAADITLGATTGYFSILTGNFRVGNGSPTTSQDGEDAYIESGLEVDGTARFDGAIDANSTADIAGNITSATGAITITDNVLIDGAADAEQLVIQGNATQTNNPFVVEQSDGTDVGTISNAGLMTLAGGLTTSDGNVVVADYSRITAQTSITMTQGGTLTPTGTYQPLTAAGAIGFGSIVAGTAGDMLVLTNESANNIVISDTGTVMLNTDRTLGQYDTIMLLSDGTNWLELSFNDN